MTVARVEYRDREVIRPSIEYVERIVEGPQVRKMKVERFEEVQEVQVGEKVVEVPRLFMVPVDRIVEVPQHIVEERIVEEPRELPCGIRG